jgi:HEPN domain-containing protein
VLSLPVVTKDAATIQKENNSIYTAGLNKVEAFLAGADLYRIRQQNKMCAFMLHQAAEQALHTLLEIKTGLRAVTHSIDKLLRYCSMVCPYMHEVFFTGYEKDKRLLSVLQKGYIDSRYNNSYTVSDRELDAITEKVREIEKMVKDNWKLTHR